MRFLEKIAVRECEVLGSFLHMAYVSALLMRGEGDTNLAPCRIIDWMKFSEECFTKIFSPLMQPCIRDLLQREREELRLQKSCW